MKRRAGEKARIVVLGGGFGGAYCAQTLSRLLRLDEAEILVIDRNNYLLFYPLLVEAGVGILEARHVAAPIRRFLRRGQFRMAEVLGADLEARQVSYRLVGRERAEAVHYDHLVFALGSITRIPPIPGLAEHCFQLKSLVDAIALRDRAIRLLELANATPDPAERQGLLTFVVVGASYTGVEFAGEYQSFLCDAIRSYPNLDEGEVRVIMLEYSDRILPTTSKSTAEWCRRTLMRRGIDCRMRTTLTEVGEDYCVTSEGDRIPTRTVLWAAGIAPGPMISSFGLPVDAKGYIQTERDLRVRGLENVWAIGDAAAVPTADGSTYAATAQNASRQGPLCAQNIVAVMRGEPTKTFDFRPLGSFAAIGHRQAVADVFGIGFTGFLGWFLYRTTYLMKMPTWGLRLRLMTDWTTAFLFRNEPVQLGLHRPEGGGERAPSAPGEPDSIPRPAGAGKH